MLNNLARSVQKKSHEVQMIQNMSDCYIVENHRRDYVGHGFHVRSIQS